MRHLLIILFLSLVSLSIVAQGPNNKYNPKIFEVVKFKGTIGKYPITMILTLFPDENVTGYYYYDNIGRFIRISKPINEKRPCLLAQSFENFETGYSGYREYFEFTDSSQIHKSVAKAQWVCDQKTLPVILHRDSTILDWRWLELTSISYFKNSYFNTQTKEYSIIYPSLSSSPILNEFFLKYWSISKEMMNFINSTKSNYLHIDQNFGEFTDDLEGNGWDQNISTELAFISDSIITYKTTGFSYGNHGYSWEGYKSLKISSGEKFSISNIFKATCIDSVLFLLKNKYKDILQEYNPNVVSNSVAPYFSNYNKDTEIFLSKGGVYFRARLFDLADYYDLFLSYKEIEDYLDESFKRTKNCP